MHGRATPFRNLCRWLRSLLCCLLLLACSDGAAPGPTIAQSEPVSPHAPLRLDLADRTLVYPIEALNAEPEQAKFVQVEIAGIRGLQPVGFMVEVRYRPPAGEARLLGSFSPFPADEPGTFIVPTQGRLRAGGAILLSLVPLQEVGPEHDLQVMLESVSLRRE